MAPTLLDSHARARLTPLLTAVGPSGHEAPAARVWRAMAHEITSDVGVDAAGNSFATVQGTVSRAQHGPTVLLAAHIDEIGLVVRHIDDKGYLWVENIGGWDPAVLIGQRITFVGRGGHLVTGVVGRRATHLMSYEEQESKIKVKSLWVDIGASSLEDAETVIEVGDAGVIDVAPVSLRNGLLSSRALDNRLSAFIVLEALRQYAASTGEATVVATANTQEEYCRMGGGALIAANRVKPDVALVLDLTHASDHPDLEEADVGRRKLGSGVVIVRGGSNSPIVSQMLREVATDLNTPYSLEAIGNMSGTDMDAVAVANQGIPVGILSVPCRYMHSPNETVSLDDVASAIGVVAEFCRRVSKQSDFAIR